MGQPQNQDHPSSSDLESSKEVLRRSRSNELFIGVVAPVGAGAGTAAGIIKDFLEKEEVNGEHFKAEVIKASKEIRAWAQAHSYSVPGADERKSLEGIIKMQDAGDKMRLETGDNAAVARAAIHQIQHVRAVLSGLELGELDGKPRAYIIDALRHPAEVHLLRRIYQDAFTLVGVVCDPEARETRLRKELFLFKDRDTQTTKEAIAAFMERDADAPERNGQHVTDTFHQADYFVDNSQDAPGGIMNTALMRHKLLPVDFCLRIV